MHAQTYSMHICAVNLVSVDENVWLVNFEDISTFQSVWWEVAVHENIGYSMRALVTMTYPNGICDITTTFQTTVTTPMNLLLSRGKHFHCVDLKTSWNCYSSNSWMGLRSLSLYSSWHQLHVHSTRNVSPTLGMVFAVSTLFEKFLQLSPLAVSRFRTQICLLFTRIFFSYSHSDYARTRFF